MAMLAGQIVSSLIPLADVRDVVANLVHGDYLFAGLSVLGLVPTVGDVVKVAGKVGKFIVKNLDQASEVIKILEFLNKNFPDMLKSLGKNDTFVDAIDQFTKADNLKLTKNQKKRWNEILERVELEDYVFDGGSSGSTDQSGSINQVEYGSTDLSQEAIRYRQENNITGARNIAVYEYENNGQLCTIVGASQRNQGHAERLIAKELENMGIQPAQVRRIYSELEPCSIPGGYCKRFLQSEFPQADVTYSFEYGLTQESRRAGVNALKEAVKNLFK